MNCLETERLISYAYYPTDEPAAAVRAHLEDCPRCREIVEPYGRLDTVLKAPAPVATGYSPDATTHAGAGPAQHVRGLALAHTAMNDDKDAQALEAYDLAANFDLLSELPEAETQVAK